MENSATMTTKPVFRSVFPIGNSDVNALPVKEIAPAIGYYRQVLGFMVREHDAKRATLVRDEVIIGLEVNGVDPEQASVYFNVSDVDAVRAELAAKGIEPSEISSSEHSGNQYRIFFAKEPYGVCFCFGQPA